VSVLPSDSAARAAFDHGDRRGFFLTLQGRFELAVDNGTVGLRRACQRLLAFMALTSGPLFRSFVAGKLWTDVTDERAEANLRATLCRLPRPGAQLVGASHTQVWLSSSVRVDVREATQAALRLIDSSTPLEPRDAWSQPLSTDLLPDWYDDWLAPERERFRQLRLHALESLCSRLRTLGDYAHAVEAGLAAVAAEPLRETANLELIETYMAEGNQSEALRQYNRLSRLLHDELGIDPSERVKRAVPH
jgi:DNA-binding SARP family transcriptional activator